jgi:hypothetical protein
MTRYLLVCHIVIVVVFRLGWLPTETYHINDCAENSLSFSELMPIMLNVIIGVPQILSNI